MQALKRKLDEVTGNDKSVYEDLYRALRYRPNDQAVEVFRRLRTGANVESLLKHIQDGDLLLQMALRPETRYRYDLPYIKTMPPFLEQTGNPYLTSYVYGMEFDIGDEVRPAIAEGSGHSDTSNLVKDRHQMYVTPYYAAELVEPKLDNVVASNWTNIPCTNVQVRSILKAYFLFVYPGLPIFHKDLFIDDMISGKHRFCSSLLFNTVLALGCVRIFLNLLTMISRNLTDCADGRP